MARKPDIRPWIYKAEEDYRAALTLAQKRRDPVPDNVCFSAQQCVEKYLKAFLVHHRKGFPKTHDLLELLKIALTVDPLLPRLGYLAGSDAASESTRTEAFRRALRQLGYIEGQNIAFEYRYGEARSDRFHKLATELVRLNVDMIVVSGGRGLIAAAKNATQAIPIVMVGLGFDPVKAGLVESLARLGGNVTGITNLARELAGKRLELLNEAVPKVARVTVLYDPANRPSMLELKEFLPAPARAGVDSSALGDKNCGGFREGIRCA
jgi:hypothetical protein